MFIWADYSILEKVIFVLAASATVILIIQTLLSLIGMIHIGGGDFEHGDLHMDHGADLHMDHGADLHMDHGTDIHVDHDTHVEHGGEVHDGHIGHDMHHEGTSHNEQDEHETDHHDATGLRLFTIRGVLAFFAIGGWTALILLEQFPTVFALLIGFVVGLFAMFLIAKLFQVAYKMQSDGNINIKNALGLSGEVYLTVPESGKGRGKVSVTVQERLTECEAITNEEESIPTGSVVRVVDVLETGILVVEKL
ncbi:MAG: hypothetical protein LBI03_01460 [Clostridiales bacterium]|jgi:hypothetical protein|nr:hypothetical protein [Clostridiales bacterium]